MSLVIDVPQPLDARSEVKNIGAGVTLTDLVADVFKNTFAAPLDTEKQKQLNASSVTLLQQWLKESESSITEDGLQSEEELMQFKKNLNVPRQQAGGRLLFPEVGAEA
ncbi:MAG: hypothetical protein M3Y56_10195 [Armatimonadota bacterium]|nr:hypothetical protein [Armatimonadota bacterium]